MEIREFAKKLQRAMKTVLGEDYEVKLQEVEKNNGVLLQGLIILAKEQNVSPTIYLKPFWEAYEDGVTMAELVRNIVKIYREDTPKESVDMSFFKDFEQVKDRICYRLIHAEQNARLLEKIPHIPFLDLAICFYYAYDGEALGRGTIMVYDTHMALWQTNTKELMKLAQKNTPRLFPWDCNSMESVIEEMIQEQEALTGERLLEEKDQQQFLTEMPMQILSNRVRIHGAASILYPGLLKCLADKMDASFYILPSSVHEVILLLDTGYEHPADLKSMIAEVNRTQVEPQEVLSDSLYFYDRVQNKVRII